jgi:hypothetical protein
MLPVAFERLVGSCVLTAPSLRSPASTLPPSTVHAKLLHALSKKKDHPEEENE